MQDINGSIRAILAIAARQWDFGAKAHKGPEYLRLNPDGMVPTLVLDRPPS
jgi:glutathione S-transferase